MLFSILLVTTLAATPSGPDALVGIWGFEEQAILTLYPERVATAGTGAWLWTHEAQSRIRLVHPSGKEPDQVLPYRLDAGKLVLTLPPPEKAGSLQTVLLMAARQNQQEQQVGKSATFILESLPVPPELLAPYSKTAPTLLSDQYVRASDQIFYLTQGTFSGLSGTPPEVKRLPGVNAASFKVLWENIGKDRDHTYCPELLALADGASFSPVPNDYAPWFKDRTSLWLGCQRQLKLLPGQDRGAQFDSASFKVLSCTEVKDKDGTFRQSTRKEPEPSSGPSGIERQAAVWLSLNDPRSKQERFVPICKPFKASPIFRKGTSR